MGNGSEANDLVIVSITENVGSVANVIIDKIDLSRVTINERLLNFRSRAESAQVAA